MSDGGWTTVGFWVFAAMAIGPAVMILSSNKIVHAAFWLLGSLLGFAGLYLTIGADFLAFTQLLVYVGGILVLILFGVMLTERDPILVRKKSERGSIIPGAIVTVAVFAAVLRAILGTNWGGEEIEKPVTTTARIGELFMTKYILPFEVVSVLILAALVGAVYIARGRDREEAEEEVTT